MAGANHDGMDIAKIHCASVHTFNELSILS
jgi:hypothetical protein